MKYLILLCGLLLTGCVAMPLTNGIPNFAVVDTTNNVYRGGQPTAEGWKWLAQHGVKWDVKLNTFDEAMEPYVILNGTNLVVTTQPWLYPDTALIWVDDEGISFATQLFGYNDYEIDCAVQSIVDRPKNLYIHCEHGQDRTGLITAIYRVEVQGWSKADAEKEMLAHGFHKELRGLWKYWQNFEK